MTYTKTNWINDSPPPINATNLNKIEAGIYRSYTQFGTLANRPSPTSAEVLLYFATDTKQLFLNNGSNWLEVSNELHASQHEAGGADEIDLQGIQIGDNQAYLGRSGNDLTFTDPATGTKTLSELATGAPEFFTTVALDGTGMFTDIQSAIDSLTSGGTIYVKRGTYTSTELYISGVPIQLIGEEGALISCTLGGSGVGAINITNAPLSKLENLQIRFQDSSLCPIIQVSNSADVVISNCRNDSSFVNRANGLIEFSSSPRAIISNCRLLNASGNRIYLSNCNSSVVKFNSGDSGTTSTEYFLYLTSCYYCRVIGNFAESLIEGYYGIKTYAGDYNIVTNNVVPSISLAGFNDIDSNNLANWGV